MTIGNKKAQIAPIAMEPARPNPPRARATAYSQSKPVQNRPDFNSESEQRRQNQAAPVHLEVYWIEEDRRG
jgi:hypothetical protein